jgi:polyisoprenoid-binding protein YceI
LNYIRFWHQNYLDFRTNSLEDAMAELATAPLTAAELGERLRAGQLAGTWTLDPARSEVRLHTRHTWVAPLTGVFSQVSGEGSVSADGAVRGTLTIAATSIDTRNPRRDKHLRSADFFDVAKHPDITFTVEGVAPAGEGARVTGTLTVRDQSRPVAFDAAVAALDGELRLTARVPVNRADYGLTWNMLGVAAMKSEIAIRAVFTRA